MKENLLTITLSEEEFVVVLASLLLASGKSYPVSEGAAKLRERLAGLSLNKGPNCPCFIPDKVG